MKYLLFACLCVTSRLIAFPLWFEPNQGQFDRTVDVSSRSTYLGNGKIAIHANGKTIVMSLPNASRPAKPEPLERLAGITNYYLGNDPSQWGTDVPHDARVRYKRVYPGVDVSYYFNLQGRLEYDFDVAANADPGAIQLSYNYPVRIDEDGDILVAGIAPGLVQGANQINILLPDAVTSTSLSIVLTAGDALSKAFNVALP